MSFTKSQRFTDRTSGSQSSSSGGGAKNNSSVNNDMSRNSSSSRKGSRPCSKESDRCSREEGFALQGSPRARSPDEKSTRASLNDMSGTHPEEGRISFPQDADNSIYQPTEKVAADEDLGSTFDVKQSPSSTSKKTSSIPVRTSSAPPKTPTKPLSTPRYNRATSLKRGAATPSPEPAVKTEVSLSSRNQGPGSTPGKQLPTKRSLEIQFYNKKKKLEELRKHLSEKQKPVLEIYQNLVNLKKQLEENGKTVVLDPIKFLSSESELKLLIEPPQAPVKAEDKGDVIEEPKIPPHVSLDIMKNSLRSIPSTFIDIIKGMHERRNEIIEMVEKSTDSSILMKLDDFKMEARMFDDTLDKMLGHQERQIAEFMDTWVLAVDRGLPEALVENDSLRRKLEEQEKTIVEMYKQQGLVTELQQKVKDLEQSLQTERAAIQESREKTATTDQKSRAMKLKMRDVENKTRDYEAKMQDLNNHLQQAQANMRTKERQWEKEKQEFLKVRRQDQLVIEKMTKDKAATESRLKAVSELLSEKEVENQTLQRNSQAEMENLMKKFMEEKLQRDEMQSKYECMQQELIKVGMSNQQAIDVIKNRRLMEGDVGECNTLREQELYTELKATQVALKDAQEQLELWSVEKLRFIDSIDKMNEFTEEGTKNLAKVILQKDDEISNLSNMVKEKNESIDKMSVDMRNLQAKVEFMQAKFGALQVSHDMDASTAELKETINEGKMKLEYALKKSLDNEQKVIKYENEIEKQQKTINEMENLLKVRDGLIGMIKLKKDELVAENNSLSKYAHEMRQLLLEAKEELRVKVQLISELTTSIANYQKQNYKLEKKLRDLEGVLSTTNEKRYKLQDAVGTMEKELQTTKAHMNHLTDMQTRYDEPCVQEYDVRKCSSMPQRINPITMYKRYKHIYDKSYKKRILANKKQVPIKSLNSTIVLPKNHSRKYDFNIRLDPAFEAEFEDFSEPCYKQKQVFDETYNKYLNDPTRQTNIRICNVCPVPEKIRYIDTEPFRGHRTVHTLSRDKEFLKNMRKLSRYDKFNERTKVLGSPQDNTPFTYEGYKSAEPDTLVVYNPSSFTKLNRAFIQHHGILNKSSTNLRQTVDDSLHLIEAKILKAKTSYRED